MAYLSKETVLSAYKVLSTLSSDPLAQGATQKISALRYIIALDMFYRAHNRPCNTQDRSDASEYIDYVGDVVAVNESFYTTNFYTTLKDNSDYAVGSNFYSVNVVHESVANGGERLVFPRRGSNPLMYVQSGKLYEEKKLIPNIKAYIRGDEHKTALVLWLIRNTVIGEGPCYVEAKNALSKYLTQDLINQILPSSGLFDVYCKKIGVKLSHNLDKPKMEEVLSLFENSTEKKALVVNNPMKKEDSMIRRFSAV